MNLDRSFIDIIKKRLVTYKDLGEGAIAQLNNNEIHKKQQKGENSVYVIVKHMRGNMLSRFTDFLDSDGEKSWRNRDEEFMENEEISKAQLLGLWQEGWDCVLQAVESLKDTDLQKEVSIRGEPHLVLDALLRQVAHYAYHVGQIVYLAKNLKGASWTSLSISPGASEHFNRQMKAKYESS